MINNRMGQLVKITKLDFAVPNPIASGHRGRIKTTQVANVIVKELRKDAKRNNLRFNMLTEAQSTMTSTTCPKISFSLPHHQAFHTYLALITNSLKVLVKITAQDSVVKNPNLNAIAARPLTPLIPVETMENVKNLLVDMANA